MDKICYDDSVPIGKSGRPKNPKRTKKYYRREEPFLCPECNKAWQFTTNYFFIEYIHGFPKIGCTKKIWRSCKEENYSHFGDDEEDKEKEE